MVPINTGSIGLWHCVAQWTGAQSSVGKQGDDHYSATGIPRLQLILDSAEHLRLNLQRVPAIVLPLMAGRTEGQTHVTQAVMWGSIVQACWNFMLALHSHGLGSVWTTAHLEREREVAELLAIPFQQYSQVGLFPVAYTLGTDFRKAYRKPFDEVVTWNRF